MNRRSLMGLVILVLLFLVLRISTVIFSFDNIYFDSDELSRGALAKEIMSRPMLPLFDYLDGDAGMYEGGRLLISLTTVPFFWLFGDSYFSLKLVAIFYSLITLICWYTLLKIIFKGKVALLWSALFILSPPFYTQASLVTWGAHAEYYFFTAIFFLFFYKIYFEGQIYNASDKTWIAFGVLSGLGFWIIQHNALVLVICFLFFFIKDRRFFLKKQFFVYFLSFFAGYSPNLYHVFTRHWRHAATYDSVLTHFPREEVRNIIPKFFSLLARDIPQSFMFAPQIISYIYYFVFLAALVYLIWLNRKSFLLSGNISREFPFLVYFLLYLIAYTVGDFAVCQDEGMVGYLRYNYLSLVYPVIFLVIALILNKLWERKKKMVTLLLFSTFLIFGFKANIGLISFRDFGSPLKEKGYSYFDLGDKLPWGLTKKGLHSLLGNIRWINPEYGPEFLRGIASAMAFNESINQDVVGTMELFAMIPKGYQQYLYRGWGFGLNDILLSEPSSGLGIVKRAGSQMQDKYKKDFYEELGRGIIVNAQSVNGLEKLVSQIAKETGLSSRGNFYNGVTQGLLETDPDSRTSFIQSNINNEDLKSVISALETKAL